MFSFGAIIISFQQLGFSKWQLTTGYWQTQDRIQM